MKYTKHLQVAALWILVLVIAVGFVSTDPAHAWGKKKEKKEHSKHELKAVNLHQHPEMVFVRGTLKQDAFGNWSLDKQPLGFDRHSRVTQKGASSGQSVVMEEGHEARIMGHMVGETLVIHRLTMIDTNESIQRGSYSPGKKELDPGEGNGSESH